MKSEDKAMILFFSSGCFCISLMFWLGIGAANLSNCLEAGMQWVDNNCVVIEGKPE